MSHDPVRPSDINPTKPSVARSYDYLLGGKDNLAIDRKVGDMLRKVVPDAPLTARANRQFGQRAVKYIAEQGIRQFIDLGSGIPTTPLSVHETARAVHPDATVVYVDINEIAVAHSGALRSVGPGLTTILADIREPDVVINHPELNAIIDFEQPVGVLIFSVVDVIPDSDDPWHTVRRFREQMAPGSFFALAHLSARSKGYAQARSHVISKVTGFPRVQFRPDDEILRFFDGFDLVEPGLVDITQWRPWLDAPSLRIKLMGGVGRRSD